MPTARPDSASIESGTGLYAGVDPAPPELPSGAITTLAATNTRNDLDPRYDELANPNYPAAGPWANQWSTVTDFCGSVFATGVGTHGTLMQYGGAGHSAINALFWIGFDVADLTWKRIGPRPLPTNGLVGYSAGVSPDPAGFDHTWGEWDGDWTGFAEAFRQPGVIALEGSHTRNRMVYRPPSAAGNTKGEIIIGWKASSFSDSAQIAASHNYDLDTTTWVRHGNQRASAGAHMGGLVYHEVLDIVTGPNQASGGTAGGLGYFDCSTQLWTARTFAAGGRNHASDATAFGWVDGADKSWHIVCWHKGAVSPPMSFFGCRVDQLVANTASWTDLTVSASTWPVNGSSVSYTVAWARCPLDGCYYAANRVHGSNKLWKLTPPVSGVVTDTWTVTETTLTGDTLDARTASGASGTSYDYSRLQWCPALSAFLWTPDYVSGSVQAIRPVGV